MDDLFQEKINHLISSPSPKNHSLAALLLQGQPGFSPRTAFLYIWNYQSEKNWKNHCKRWELKIDQWHFSCYFYYHSIGGGLMEHVHLIVKNKSSTNDAEFRSKYIKTIRVTEEELYLEKYQLEAFALLEQLLDKLI